MSIEQPYTRMTKSEDSGEIRDAESMVKKGVVSDVQEARKVLKEAAAQEIVKLRIKSPVDSSVEETEINVATFDSLVRNAYVKLVESGTPDWELYSGIRDAMRENSPALDDLVDWTWVEKRIYELIEKYEPIKTEMLADYSEWKQLVEDQEKRIEQDIAAGEVFRIVLKEPFGDKEALELYFTKAEVGNLLSTMRERGVSDQDIIDREWPMYVYHKAGAGLMGSRASLEAKSIIEKVIHEKQ